MNQHVDTPQQEQDIRAQDDLTAKVGVKLSRPEKATSSPWSTVKRLFRIG